MPLLYHFRYAASPELKIKMNVYNKLKIAILAIIASQNIHAMTLDPIQIQSAPGELLYAEINFRNADPNASIRADLASAEDLIAMGAGHQPPGHLNFFTRKDSSGSGVITITSSRPLTDAELNIIVKISEGNSSRLQHIKTPLKRSMPISQQMNAARNERTLAPVIISNERDIALNLPVSAQYAALKPNAAGQPKETLLSLNSSLPPSMDKNKRGFECIKRALNCKRYRMKTAIILCNISCLCYMQN
jgi:pilus assembly protein FimV